MLRTVVVIGSILMGVGAYAQQTAQAPGKEVFGTVTGHVFCEDTNAPARLARVTLVAVKDVSDFDPDAKKNDSGRTYSLIETMLDGSFAATKVKPGTYYVVAEKEGYLSGMERFNADDLNKPTAETKDMIAKAFRKVTVEGNQTANIEVRLERGAAINGMITYDDGSPAAGLTVEVREQGSEGKWQALSHSVGRAGVTSDDQGRYRVSGVAPGEYILEARLQLQDISTSGFLVGGSNSVMWNQKYALSVYSGAATRAKDATSFKVITAEDRSGEDLVVPLSKLHAIAGTVAAERDGHAVNAATVKLVYADDKSEVASTRVENEEGFFRFEFVPEGSYLIEVSSAKDVSREEKPNPPGYFPRFDVKETDLHDYAEKEQPLLINGDMTNLVVAVPEKKAKTGNPAASTAQ
jgi:hypothetical protein